jgi:LemA protein
MKKTALIVAGGVLGGLVLIVLILGLWVRGTYNGLVEKETAIDTQWSQVETQYQRRFDLIPNLVESVKGIFEQDKKCLGGLQMPAPGTPARPRLTNARRPPPR